MMTHVAKDGQMVDEEIKICEEVAIKANAEVHAAASRGATFSV